MAALRGPPKLARSASVDQVESWLDSPPGLNVPAFKDAYNIICVVPELMADSKVQSLVTDYERQVAEDPITEPLATTISRLCRAAGCKKGSERSFYVSVPGIASGSPMSQVAGLHSQLRAWQRPIFHAALLEIATNTLGDGTSTPSDPITAQSMLALLCRGYQQCHARKVACLMTALECASNMRDERLRRAAPAPAEGAGVPPEGAAALLDASSKAADGSKTAASGAGDGPAAVPEAEGVAKARATVMDFLLGKLDEWKEKAMASAFLEPSKAYYHAAGDRELEGDADVHGTNISLTLLAALLGVRCARQPFIGDEAKGCIPWRSSQLATKEVVAAMENKSAFGKPWSSVRAMRAAASQYFRDLQHRHAFVVRGAQPQHIIAGLLKPSERAKQEDVAQYLRHFASYFAVDWLPERLVMMLLSTEGREGALAVCFEAMRREENAAFDGWADGLGREGGADAGAASGGGGTGDAAVADEAVSADASAIWKARVLEMYQEEGSGGMEGSAPAGTGGGGKAGGGGGEAGSSLRGSVASAAAKPTEGAAGATAEGKTKTRGASTAAASAKVGRPAWPRIDDGHDHKSFFMDEDYVQFLQSRAVRMLGWLGVLKPAVVEAAQGEEWRLFAMELEAGEA